MGWTKWRSRERKGKGREGRRKQKDSRGELGSTVTTIHRQRDIIVHRRRVRHGWLAAHAYWLVALVLDRDVSVAAGCTEKERERGIQHQNTSLGSRRQKSPEVAENWHNCRNVAPTYRLAVMLCICRCMDLGMLHITWSRATSQGPIGHRSLHHLLSWLAYAPAGLLRLGKRPF